MKGMRKYRKKSNFGECPSCPFVQETKVLKSTQSNNSVEVNTAVDCQTIGVIYCITCAKCSQQYIGTTKKSLQYRFGCHQGYVRNRDLSQPTGRHFSTNGHSIADMRICIVEKVYSFDRLLREERESEFIRKFNSKFKGMNVNSWIALLYVFVMLLFVPHRYLSTLKPQILWLSCTRLMMKL